MITKVSDIYRVDIQKHYHQQIKDGNKKKQQEEFKDVLAKVLTGVSDKPARHR